MPAVSVVIPTYNHAAYVTQAIESVLAQSYRDFEIIVVDDGSTDETQELLQPFIGPGSIQYVHQDNAGLPAARNVGIHHARGEYIAHLDADDLFMPEKLEKQVELLKAQPEAGLVHCDYSKFDHQDNDLGYRDTSFYSGNIYPQMLLQWSVLMAAPCVVVPRHVFERVGMFDERLTTAEDLDMWRRIAKAYPFAHLPEDLAKIRVLPESMSSDKTKAAPLFRIYLDKAFAEDSGLSAVFKRRVLGKMYSNVSHNLLGEGTSQNMNLVRRHALHALRFWPFTWGAYLGWLSSWLGGNLRARLARIWRRLRYRPKAV